MTRPAILSAVALAVALAVAGCSASQLATVERVVANGQLYCAKATASGPLVIALANAAGVPVTVTGRTAAYVQAACGVIGAIPVAPPASPALAPVVAASVPPVLVTN